VTSPLLSRPFPLSGVGRLIFFGGSPWYPRGTALHQDDQHGTIARDPLPHPDPAGRRLQATDPAGTPDFSRRSFDLIEGRPYVVHPTIPAFRAQMS
jgi:hypothetical protein